MPGGEHELNEKQTRAKYTLEFKQEAVRQVKAGQLNYVVHKGILFKTYEGKLIQTGLRAQGASLNSYEFEFSVADKGIANELMARSGDQFTLHYKEYLGALPWRGHSVYVVDSIMSSENVDH